jgi:hypothetical protein
MLPIIVLFNCSFFDWHVLCSIIYFFYLSLHGNIAWHNDDACRVASRDAKAPFGSHKQGDLKRKKCKISHLWNQTALT